MTPLKRQLLKLCDHNRDGSFATQSNRRSILCQIADQLDRGRYPNMFATSLSGRHVEYLVEGWQAAGLSAGTQKNRMSALRWWAEKIGKAGMIPASNDALGIERRTFTPDESRAQTLDADKLALVTDAHVRMSLRLEEAFGLRREEAIKIFPALADRGDKLVLKGSWTKGGRPREIPVRNETQRALLDEVKAFVGAGALIPADRNYKEQMRMYESQCRAAGLARMHGLRHRYAQQRYEEMTGWKSPMAGGPARSALTWYEREVDHEARRVIAEELGHGRVEVTVKYLGR